MAIATAVLGFKFSLLASSIEDLKMDVIRSFWHSMSECLGILSRRLHNLVYSGILSPISRSLGEFACCFFPSTFNIPSMMTAQPLNPVQVMKDSVVERPIILPTTQEDIVQAEEFKAKANRVSFPPHSHN